MTEAASVVESISKEFCAEDCAEGSSLGRTRRGGFGERCVRFRIDREDNSHLGISKFPDNEDTESTQA